MEKLLVIVMEKEIYNMSLEHLIVLESKFILKNNQASKKC